MSSRELSEWIAYDQLDRIPDPHWIGGMIAWTVASFMGTGKRRWHIDDFIPRDRPVRIMRGEEGLAMMQGITALQKAAEMQAKLKSGRMGEDIETPA